MIFLLKLVVFETVETKVKQKKERKKITTQLKISCFWNGRNKSQTKERKKKNNDTIKM